MRITILTTPNPKGTPLRHRVKQLLAPRVIGGHYAVTRSLLCGMDALGVRYNYNPPFAALVAPVTWVVSGVETLRYALQLKRDGWIRFLLAGPNISVLPSWDDGLVAHDMVDVCMVNSPWTLEAYVRDTPSLQGRIVTWPAGVDEGFWRPAEDQERDTVLVYCKSPDAPVGDVLTLLRSMGLRLREISYGNYTAGEYRQALARSFCAVFLSRSESQGLALAEAWAMDVPTLVWNPGKLRLREQVVPASAAPYLTPETGAFWLELPELRHLLRQCQNGQNKHAPRTWVLREMTDRVCAQKFMTLLAERTHACKDIDKTDREADSIHLSTTKTGLFEKIVSAMWGKHDR